MRMYFLLGLNVLTAYSLILYFADDKVWTKTDDWSLQIESNNGHIYLDWIGRLFYTAAELRKIHRHSPHPKSDRLYTMMHKANSKEVPLIYWVIWTVFKLHVTYANEMQMRRIVLECHLLVKILYSTELYACTWWLLMEKLCNMWCTEIQSSVWRVLSPEKAQGMCGVHLCVYGSLNTSYFQINYLRIRGHSPFLLNGTTWFRLLA